MMAVFIGKSEQKMCNKAEKLKLKALKSIKKQTDLNIK